MNILAVVAHPDDEVLGCGGTMAKHAEAGDQVRVLIIGHGRANHNAAQAIYPVIAKAGNAIGYSATLPKDVFVDNQFERYNRQVFVKLVEHAVEQHKPDVVYTHHAWDVNEDHRIVFQAVLVACRPLPGSSVKRVLSFEVPSSTECGPPSQMFRPTVYVPLTDDQCRKKDVAVQAYADEMRDYPHPRSRQGIAGLMVWRGASCGHSAAEAFELVREIA